MARRTFHSKDVADWTAADWAEARKMGAAPPRPPRRLDDPVARLEAERTPKMVTVSLYGDGRTDAERRAEQRRQYVDQLLEGLGIRPRRRRRS